MSRHKKIFRQVIGVLGGLLVLLLAFLILLPRLVNLEPISEKVLAAFSDKVGGELKYQRIDVLFLPNPHLIIHQGKLSISENISGNIKSITVYPEVLPLITGKLRIASVRLEAPDFKIRLSGTLDKDNEKQNAFTQRAIGEKMAPLLKGVKSLFDFCSKFIKVNRRPLLTPYLFSHKVSDSWGKILKD